jgi:NAD(P)-dependent dehydrogenase (short-subunit alcohol dehydrogenase family)
VADDGAPELADESVGLAPSRGRLVGRRVLVVGAGQDDHGLDDPPIGNGRAISLLAGREGASLALADREVVRCASGSPGARLERAVLSKGMLRGVPRRVRPISLWSANWADTSQFADRSVEADAQRRQDQIDGGLSTLR